MKGGYYVEHEVTGGRRPGALKPDPPTIRRRAGQIRLQGMGDVNEVPQAAHRVPTTMWFNTTGEFDRWYRRLHPIRHSVAKRLVRIEREQQCER